MENEQISKSTGTPAVAVAADSEAQMFFGGTSERILVFISKLVEKTVWERVKWEDLEEPDWEELGVVTDVGAIPIGELTRRQYAVFRKEFEKVCKGLLYVFGFQCEQPLPDDEKMSLAVVLDNYVYLTDEQKKILDTALRIANKIREADGCGDKNTKAQKSKAVGVTRGGKTKGKKGKIVDKKFEDLIYREPEKAELSAARLAKILKCSKTAIIDSPTWEKIMNNREKPQVASWEDPGQIPDRSVISDDQN